MFLDTSGILSLFDDDDGYYKQSVKLFEGARRFLTHNYVLAEFVALANVRGMPRAKSLEYILDLTEHPLIDVLWVDESFHQAAMRFLRRRADKDYSLCDAVSFLQTEQERVAEALTTDHHFEQEGLIRLPK
jgi:uncharacterized protein